MPPVSEPVLAISPDNDRLHVGNAATVLSHVTAETPPDGSPEVPVDWTFYDSRGVRLVEDDGGAGLVAADATAALPDRPARQVLVSRVDLVLAHAQLRLDLSIAELLAGEEQLHDGDSVRMVRVQGELADVLTMLAALDKDLDPSPHGPDPGSWWHEFWAH